MKIPTRLPIPHQRGFSLVELLVAMVISLIIMAGVVNSFLASKDAFNYNEEMAFIQDNARFAANRLATDIRSAGDFGCLNDIKATSATQTASTLHSMLGSTAGMAAPDLYTAIGVQGYNLTTGYPSATIQAAVTGANNSDAIIVRHADISNQMTVTTVAGTVFTLTAANQSYDAGTIMVYTDAKCSYEGIFQSRGPAKSPTTTTLNFGTGGASGAAPGNATALTVASVGDSKIAPLSSSVYYIAASNVDTSMNSLWVTYLDNNGALKSEELILGVDDMRIYYGVDTDTTPDGFANKYVKADLIGTNQDASGGNTLAWNRVASVRVQLLLRSRNTISSNPTQTLQWDTGSSFTKNDGHLWQIASVTIRLRNAFRG